MTDDLEVSSKINLLFLRPALFQKNVLPLTTKALFRVMQSKNVKRGSCFSLENVQIIIISWIVYTYSFFVRTLSTSYVCTFKVIHGKWLLGMKSCQNIIETVSLMSVHISNAKGYGDDFFPLGLLLTRAFCDFTKLFSISSSNPISSSCC